MSHQVTFKVPARPLGKADIEFIVRRNGDVFGTLRISKGSLVWYPRKGNRGRKVGWRRFDAFMSDKPMREVRSKARPD